MEIQRDSKEQPYIHWEHAGNKYRRAWIRHSTGAQDWAGTGRYVNVGPCDSAGRVKGHSADFPIYNDLPDEQVLLAFVSAVNAMTGWKERGE